MTGKKKFNESDIIDKAMHVFWSKGYASTSLSDLTEATGLLKGSLYNTFESKEKLFLLCLEKYGYTSSAYFYSGEDPTEYLKSFFIRIVDDGVSHQNYKGCLILNSCLEFAGSKSKLAEKTKILFSAIELNFEKVVKEYSKNNKCNTKQLKTSILTAAFSIKEISKFKRDRTFLTQIANNALKDFETKI